MVVVLRLSHLQLKLNIARRQNNRYFKSGVNVTTTEQGITVKSGQQQRKLATARLTPMLLPIVYCSSLSNCWCLNVFE